MTPLTPKTHNTVASLGDVSEIFLGANLSRATRAGLDLRVAILQVKDISDGLLSPRDKLNEAELDNYPKYQRAVLRSGDVIVTARGTLLKCALVSDEHAGVLPTSNLIVVRPTPALILPELVLAVLRDSRIQADLAKEVAGVAVPTLRVSSVARVSLVVPPLEEQQDLARLIALGETQYQAALQAASLRRDLAREVVIRKVEPQS